MKWIEAILTRNAKDKVIMEFLEGYIFSRFGCLKKLVTDNAHDFKSNSMIEFCKKYSIKLVHSTPYYPQGNGLVESSNKTLIRIIKKLLAENKKSWDSKLKFSFGLIVSVKISLLGHILSRWYMGQKKFFQLNWACQS
jgi:transposase InsO family protein